MEKRLKALDFEYNDKQYSFMFGFEEVKKLANYSVAKKGKITDADFIKFALQKDSEVGFITDKTAKEIQELLVGGIELEDGETLTYEETLSYLISLFEQAINDAASEVEPAIIKIENDNSVTITVDGKSYKLTFTREIISEAFSNNIFEFNNIFDLYVVGSTLIRTALEHYNKRFSVKLSDQIFLAAWATMLEEDTKDDFTELIHALTYHMKEVIESGSKKSKAAIKMKTR